MLFQLFAAFVLSVSAPSAVQQDDAAWLVPPDATVLVRLESAESWNALVRAFAPLAGEQAAEHDLQSILDGMAAPGASAPRLDPTRPIYLAFELDPSAGPAFTLVAPVTNGQPFRFQPNAGPATNAVHGAYTGVSNRAGYAASASPNPMLAALRPGLVSVHLDLATLVDTFRPVIDTGLDQFEMMLDRPPVDDSLDVQPLMEAYLSAARELVASAASLDLAFERRGDQLALRFDFLERVDRAHEFPVADVTPLLGYVDPSCSMQMALDGKATDYFALFADFTEAVLRMYPEPLRTDLQGLLASQDQLGELLLPGLVAGFDFGAQGMNGTYVLRSSKPAELQSKLEDMLRGLDHEGGLLRVGAAERLAVEGMEARVLPLEIQQEALLKAAAGMGARTGGLPPEAEQQFRSTMETLYGRDLRLAMVPKGELLALVLAGDEEHLRSGVAHLMTPAAPPAKLGGLLAELEPGALAFAYHLDFGRWMGQVFSAFQGLVPGSGVSFPDRQASFGCWGSTSGRRWSGGTTMSLAELIGFVQAMQEMGSK